MRQETNPMCEQLDFLDLEDLIQLQDFNDTESTPTLPNQVNFLQLNQHKSEIVDQLTKNFVLSFNKRNANTLLVCILQEPYYYKYGNLYGPDSTYEPIYYKQPGKRARAAIWCPKAFNPRPVFQIMSQDVAAAAITLQSKSYLIISLYIILRNKTLRAY